MSMESGDEARKDSNGGSLVLKVGAGLCLLAVIFVAVSGSSSAPPLATRDTANGRLQQPSTQRASAAALVEKPAVTPPARTVPAVSERARPRPFIGLTLREVASDQVAYRGLPAGEGVWVAKIVANSPAQRAELEEGDLILSINGRPAIGLESTQAFLNEQPIGVPLRIEFIRRDGEESTTKVLPVAWPSDALTD